MHCAGCTAPDALRRMHCARRTVPDALRRMHCAGCTASDALRRMHCAGCTAPDALRQMPTDTKRAGARFASLGELAPWTEHCAPGTELFSVDERASEAPHGQLAREASDAADQQPPPPSRPPL
eukprot:256096-Chlamydomonas_euryale.AAC.13